MTALLDVSSLQHLDVQRQGAVATVRLNRPEVRNAFHADTVAELTRVFASFQDDAELRAVVLGSTGTAFCSGADLNWMRQTADYSWVDNHRDASRLANMLWTLTCCPVPVIAEVQGDCYGGGVGLVSCCDVVVAADAAQFCLSEAKLGLIPATISPYVIHAIGERAARRYFVTAERFSAERAQALGLVHEVVALDALSATTHGIVDAILRNGPNAVRECKTLVREIGSRPITHELRDVTARRIADVRASDEGKAGLNAFLTRGTPPWVVAPEPK